MHTSLLPACPRCLGQSRQLACSSRAHPLSQQLGSRSSQRDELRTFARGRKRGTVLSEDAVSLAPYPGEPSEGGASASSSPGEESQQRQQTINSLSALFSSREQSVKKRQHDGLKGMLDVLFEEDVKQAGRQGSSTPHHARVHQRHADTRRQDQLRHDPFLPKAEEDAMQQRAAAPPSPAAPPTSNRLITMMRKQGTSMASLVEFMHHHNGDQLGIKHWVLACKLAANIFSQQCGSSGGNGSSSSSSSVAQGSSGAMDPLEVEALTSLVDMLTQRLGACVGELDPRQTAILLWSMGSLELRGATLLPALLQHVQPLLGELGPGELSSVIWACAKLGVDGAGAGAGLLAAWEGAALPTLASVSAGAAPQVHGSRPGGTNNRQYLELVTENQQLCNMAWAMAVLNRYNSRLFQALLSIFSRRLDTLQASMLVTILWAMHKVGHRSPDFTRQALAQVCEQVRTLKTNHLAMLISGLVGMMDTAEEGPRELGSSSSGGGGGNRGAADDARGLVHGSLQLAVSELQWKVLPRQIRQHAALEALSAAEVVDVMQAVVLLNQQSPARRPAAAIGGDRERGRLGYINREWQQQQQLWQQKWQQELADSSRPFDRHFSPVILAAYDDVLLLRLLMDQAVSVLPDMEPRELLQVLCVCARVGFAPKLLVAQAVLQLCPARSRMSAADLQVLSWALASVGFEDQVSRCTQH